MACNTNHKRAGNRDFSTRGVTRIKGSFHEDNIQYQLCMYLLTELQTKWSKNWQNLNDKWTYS